MTDVPIVASTEATTRRPDVTVVVVALPEGSGGLLDTLADVRASAGVRAEALVVSAGPATTAPRTAGVRVLQAPADTVPARLAELGAVAARGRTVTFVRPGDRWGPQVLARMVAGFADDSIVVAGPAGADPIDLLAGSGLVLAHAGQAAATRMRTSLGSRSVLGYWTDVVRHGHLRLAQVPGRVERAAGEVGDRSAALDDDLALLDMLAEALEGSSSPAAPLGVVDQARAWVGRRIGASVAGDPERHRAVVHEARDREIRGMPWPQINAGLGRHLAVLYAFPPSLDTSALVAARRLRAREVLTDVVSQDLGWRRPRDPDAVDVSAEFVDESIVLGRRHLDVWPDTRVFTEETLAAALEMERRKGPYLSLYSRAMWPQSHFAAAALKLRRPDLNWVAEFSDPLRHNAEGVLRQGDVGDDWLAEELGAVLRRHGYDAQACRSLFEWAELLPYALADEVLFTNEQQREVMLGYCPAPALADRARERARVEHHPVPGPDLYTRARSSYRLSSDRVHIGYFGNFYANRGISALVQALGSLELPQRDRIRLHVFTAHPEPLAQEMIERGLADVVAVSPMVGYLEHLHLATRFDALLVADYEATEPFGINPYLPAKYADYVGTGVPVWGVVEPGSVLSTLPLAHRSRIGNADDARRVLGEIVRTGSRVGPDEAPTPSAPSRA